MPRSGAYGFDPAFYPLHRTDHRLNIPILASALAVDPGWTMVLWTATLFVVLELVSNNVAEPWVYGSRTGLSPLAIIVAAIFWTWLWGPMGPSPVDAL